MNLFVVVEVDGKFFLWPAEFIEKKYGTGGWTVLTSGTCEISLDDYFANKTAELRWYYFKRRSNEELPGVFEITNDITEITLNSAAGSVFLGLFLAAAKECQKRSFKNHWASITVTGDLRYSEKDGWELKAVGSIDKKYKAVREYARRHRDDTDNKQHLFLYIGDGQEGALDEDQSIHKEAFYEGKNSLDDIIEFIFEPFFKDFSLPNHIDKNSVKAALYHSIPDHLPGGAFLETKGFRKIENELIHYPNFRSYFIWGENETGKTAMAGAMVRFLMHINKIDFPIWIDVDNEAIHSCFKDNNYSSEKQIRSYIINEINKRLVNFHGQITTIEEIEKTPDKQRYVIVFDNLQLDEETNRNFVDIAKRIISPVNFIVTCHTGYTGFDTEIIPVSVPKFNRDELGSFLKLILKNVDRKTDLEKKAKYYNKLTQLLYESIGSYPGIINILMSSFRRWPVIAIIRTLEDNDVFEISSDKRIIDRMEDIYVKLMEMLSSGARNILFTMLNFPPHSSISKEKIQAELKTAQSMYIFSRLINRIKKLLPFFDENKGPNSAIQELCNKNFLQMSDSYSQPKYHIKKFTHDILMSSEKFSFNGKRERLVDPRFTLAIALKTNPGKRTIITILGHLKKRNKTVDEIKYDQGTTPLHLAIKYDIAPKIVKLLIEKGGASVGMENNFGQTPFHTAAEYSSSEDTFAALMSPDIDINTYLNKKDDYDCIPFYYAIGRNSHTNVIQWFLDNGFKDHINTVKWGVFETNLMQLVSASNKNPDVIQFLIDKGYSVEVTNDNGVTPFHFAALFNNLAVVELFIKNGYKRATTVWDCTVLHYAAAFNNIEIVKALYSKEEIDCRNSAYWLPLHWAVMTNDDPKVIEYLFERTTEDTNIYINTDASYFISGFSTFSIPAWIIQNNNFYNKLYPYLSVYKNIEHYFDMEFDKETSYAYPRMLEHTIIDTPLSPIVFAAIYNKNIAILNWFILNGKNFTDDDKKINILHCASACNTNKDVLERLYDLGFDINTRNSLGFRPIHFAAAFNSNPQIIQWFYGKTDFNDSENTLELTPIQLAAQNNKEPAILERFFTLMKYTDMPDEDDWTLLHHTAAHNCNRNIHRYLINREPYNLNAVDCAGLTPLMLAAEHNHNWKVIKMFIEEYNCDPNKVIESNGYTLLHLAASNKDRLYTPGEGENIGLYKEEDDDDKIEFLSDLFKNKYNTRAEDGITPLHLIAQCQCLHFLEILSPSKVDLELQDDAGNSTIHYSAGNSDLSVIKWLVEEKGCDIHQKNHYGINAAHCAASNNEKADMFIFLAKSGVDIKYPNSHDGKTPLDFAKERDDWDVIEACLKNEHLL